MNYTVLDHDNTRTFPNLTHDKAKERASGIKMMIDDPSEVEIVEGVYESYEDYDSEPETEEVEPEIVDHSPKADGGNTETVEPATVTESSDTPQTTLREDPIAYLKSINPEFVNRIRGKEAISKKGFRYIQVTMGITTEAEVVESFTDPLGVIIHARAEMPDGRYAEAHGEGYRFESDVDDNEFVRYADSRAKNRAISDLTCSGALAESELE